MGGGTSQKLESPGVRMRHGARRRGGEGCGCVRAGWVRACVRAGGRCGRGRRRSADPRGTNTVPHVFRNPLVMVFCSSLDRACGRGCGAGGRAGGQGRGRALELHPSGSDVTLRLPHRDLGGKIGRVGCGCGSDGRLRWGASERVGRVRV